MSKDHERKLEGKVANITGENRRIGLAAVQHIVAGNAYVFISGRRQIDHRLLTTMNSVESLGIPFGG